MFPNFANLLTEICALCCLMFTLTVNKKLIALKKCYSSLLLFIFSSVSRSWFKCWVNDFLTVVKKYSETRPCQLFTVQFLSESTAVLGIQFVLQHSTIHKRSWQNQFTMSNQFGSLFSSTMTPINWSKISFPSRMKRNMKLAIKLACTMILLPLACTTHLFGLKDWWLSEQVISLHLAQSCWYDGITYYFYMLTCRSYQKIFYITKWRLGV